MSFWFQPRTQWKWNTLSIPLSPLSPQEKMEIANIELTQSIPLSRKGLRGMHSAAEQDWWREEWAIAGVCQVSSALCDTQRSDSSATLDLVSKLSVSSLSHTPFLSPHCPVFLSCRYTSGFSSLSSSHTLSSSVSHPLWAAILQHMALPHKYSHMHCHMRLLIHPHMHCLSLLSPVYLLLLK